MTPGDDTGNRPSDRTEEDEAAVELEEAFDEELELAAEELELEATGAKRPNVFLRLYRGQTSFDFIGNRRWWFGISALIIVLGVISLGTRGLNLGIDFKGGQSWLVSSQTLTVAEATSAVESAGITQPTVVQLTNQINGRGGLGHGEGLGGDQPGLAALEIDPQVEAAGAERDDTEHDDQGRDAEPPPPVADEVERGLAPVEALEDVGALRTDGLALLLLGGAAAAAQQDDEGPGEEVGDDDIEDGGQAEEEGESPDRPDRDEVQDGRTEQRDGVSGQHGAEGAGESAVHAGADRAPCPGLVLQTLEVDDVRVDGDADRDDEADDAGQVDRGVEALAHGGDDRPEQCSGHPQAGNDHDAQQAVVEDHVEQHQDQARQTRQEPCLQ